MLQLDSHNWADKLPNAEMARDILFIFLAYTLLPSLEVSFLECSAFLSVEFCYHGAFETKILKIDIFKAEVSTYEPL